jgi:hypothetical protein
VRLCRTENRFKEPRLLSRGAPQMEEKKSD